MEERHPDGGRWKGTLTQDQSERLREEVAAFRSRCQPVEVEEVEEVLPIPRLGTWTRGVLALLAVLVVELILLWWV